MRRTPQPLLDRKQAWFSAWALLGRPADYGWQISTAMIRPAEFNLYVQCRVSRVAEFAARPCDDIIQVPKNPAPIILPCTSVEMRVDSPLEEFKSLRGMFNSREDASVVVRYLGGDLNLRLCVIGVSRLLECLYAYQPPQVLEKHYHLIQNSS